MKELSIYDRVSTNVKQLSIDNLEYRKSVNKRKVWYVKPASSKCKCMHITQDYHDKSKHLTTMAMHQVNYNEQPTYYYLDIDSGEVRKLKEYVRKHKNIVASQVYYGTKSRAINKLEKML